MKKLLLIFLLAAAAIVFLARPYYAFVTGKLGISPVRALLPGNGLKSTNGQVNILMLGISGGDHEGPNLSDSIIVLNYDLAANKLTSFGLPRDIWSEPLKDRINSAYAYGVAKGNSATGIKLAKANIEYVIGHPVHYAVVIDFEKFKGLIDHVGGVDIEVARSFTDSKYPVAGREDDECGGDKELKCRYETLNFEKGMQHMDGEMALKFVRSRQAEGEEGSDFARSQRQQLVLGALKSAVITIAFSRDMEKINALYETLNAGIARDISNQELAVIGSRIFTRKNFNQKSVRLPEELFEVPSAAEYEGKYVLIPKDNDSDLLKNYISCMVKGETDCKVI